MPRNIEIKARVDDLAAVESAVAALASQGSTLLHQDDSFFHCRQGRLKLRVFDDGSAELIAYERPDAPGPKASTYVRVPVPEPDALRDALATSCGLIGRVRKRRIVYLVGRTRVHLDCVDGLGDFLELEVVLSDDEPAEDGVAEARVLMARLGLSPDALVAGAYLDLLQNRMPPLPPLPPLPTGPSSAG
jgi:predicted adenylyl cyclase CyaB